MITSLKINNLRCFQDFSLENITPVTLVSGKNNVGKSTLLEGIFLLIDYENPNIFLKLHHFRGQHDVSLNPQSVWEPFFTDRDPNRELCISCFDGKNEQAICIKKDESISMSGIDLEHLKKNTNIDLTLNHYYYLKLNYKFNQQSGTIYSFISNVDVRPVYISQSPHPRRAQSTHYIGTNVIEPQNTIAHLFGELELSGKKDALLNGIKYIYPQIENVLIIVSNNVGHLYATFADGKTLPLRSMGDGINKLLLICLIILTKPNCTLLIDEIENSFHYSLYNNLWKIVYKFAHECNCQVFATTHNYECISAAVNEASTLDRSTLTYVRLGREDGGITPHSFSKDDLAFALEREMEVR